MGLEIVTTICGLIGAACFASLQAPQAILNARRQSTEGLSVSLVVLWHVGSIIYAAALLAESESVWLIMSMCLFASLSATIEAQVVAYGGCATKLRVWQIAPAIFGASCAAAFGLSLGFELLPHVVVPALGEFLPAGFFAVGFFPQFVIFLRTHSVEGYSFGVTALDVIGSVANCAVIFLDDGMDVQAWIAAVPFVTIIVLHAVLVLIAIYIVCTPSSLQEHLMSPGSADLP